MAGLVDVEDRLDRHVEALHVEGLVDGPLGLTQGERRHLGDLFGQRPRLGIKLVAGTTRLTMPVLCDLFGGHRPAGEEDLLRLAGAEFPGVAVVFDAADAHEHDRVGELRVVGGHDEVAGPAQQQAAGDAPALDRGDRRLRDVAPAQRVLEVAPALVLDDELERDLVGHRPAAPQIMAGREMFPVGAQQDHRDLVSSAARVQAASSSSSSSGSGRWRPRAG